MNTGGKPHPSLLRHHFKEQMITAGWEKLKLPSPLSTESGVACLIFHLASKMLTRLWFITLLWNLP